LPKTVTRPEEHAVPEEHKPFNWGKPHGSKAFTANVMAPGDDIFHAIYLTVDIGPPDEMVTDPEVPANRNRGPEDDKEFALGIHGGSGSELLYYNMPMSVGS
jgi:hypothetical protein